MQEENSLFAMPLFFVSMVFLFMVWGVAFTGASFSGEQRPLPATLEAFNTFSVGLGDQFTFMVGDFSHQLALDVNLAGDFATRVASTANLAFQGASNLLGLNNTAIIAENIWLPPQAHSGLSIRQVPVQKVLGAYTVTPAYYLDTR